MNINKVFALLLKAQTVIVKKTIFLTGLLYNKMTKIITSKNTQNVLQKTFDLTKTSVVKTAAVSRSLFNKCGSIYQRFIAKNPVIINE